MINQIQNKVRADFDLLVDSLADDIDFSKITVFPMITVYSNTNDYPGKFVARIFDIRGGSVYATRYIMLKDSLQELRDCIPVNFVRMQRRDEDDPNILEVWI
jgi:hypothetical protein